MPPRAQEPKRLTIKQFAHDFFVKVSFVDIYGRNVGYDYTYILDRIKEQFPHARTSRRWLQDMAYVFNRSEKFPVRRRSRHALAEDYALALLTRRSGKNVYSDITQTIKAKFPEQHVSSARLRQLEKWLRTKGYTIPTRDDGGH